MGTAMRFQQSKVSLFWRKKCSLAFETNSTSHFGGCLTFVWLMLLTWNVSWKRKQSRLPTTVYIWVTPTRDILFKDQTLPP